ncbi:coiled-coil domain-containing protein [Helicobacter salomonis]|uniref:hypothetical protein n=1 Tax=Helicobacter salomonis TaxID=56878 RepID=UPI00131569E8|nr:hypothetical protein [Helicobacter salomonis]
MPRREFVPPGGGPNGAFARKKGGGGGVSPLKISSDRSRSQAQVQDKVNHCNKTFYGGAQPQTTSTHNSPDVLQLLEELKQALEEADILVEGDSMAKKKHKGCKDCEALENKIGKCIQALQQRIEGLKAEVADLRATSPAIQIETERLENEDLTEKNRELQERVATLQQQVGVDRQELVKELEELRAFKAEVEGENGLREKYNNLRTEVEGEGGLRAQRDKFKAEQDEFQTELKGKEGQEGLRAKCQRLESELEGENGQEGLREKCIRLEAEWKKLDAELNGENGTKKQLEKARQDHARELAKVKSNEEEAKKSYETLKTEKNGQLQQVQNENSRLRQDKQDLQNQLKEAKAYEKEAKNYNNLTLVHLLNLAKGSDRLLERLEINKNATLDDLFASQLGQDRLFVLKCIAEDIQHFREDLPKIQPLIAFFNALFPLLEISAKITRLQVQEGDSYNPREHATPEARQPTRGKITKVHFVGYKQGSNIIKSLVEVVN